MFHWGHDWAFIPALQSMLSAKKIVSVLQKKALLYLIVCQLAQTTVVTGRYGSFSCSLEPEWKSTRFVGDEIKFHSPSESQCLRWRLPLCLRLALARQIQMPPTSRQGERWLEHSAQCSVCVFLMPCFLQLHAISQCLCLPLCPVPAILSPHAWRGPRIALKALLSSAL